MTTTGKPGKTGRGQNGGGKPPIDSKTKTRVRKLAREGMGRNKIARETGISVYSVTRICSEARPPITFDRRAVAAAVQARSIDLKARRSELSEGLIEDLVRIRAMLWETHTVLVKGRDEDRMEEVAMTPRDMKDLAVAFGILLDKHLVIVAHDTDESELSAVDGWHAHLKPELVDVPEGWE